MYPNECIKPYPFRKKQPAGGQNVMASVSKDYKEYVLDDLENYTTLSTPRKATLLERLLIRKVPIEKLHPNPEDEFADPNIGPNNNIVGEYSNQIAFSNGYNTISKIEPIVVEKLSTGGYIILNGHHRWLAARKMNVKKVPVQIVNMTHEEDILTRISKLNNKMFVSFDLDEVLICNDGRYPTEQLSGPLEKIFPWKIRKDTGLLIRTLHKMGFDVWVYTGNYYTPQYIRMTFLMHGAKIDGVVSGMNLLQSGPTIRNAFRKKYKTIVHIDSELLVWVNRETNSYDSFELPPDHTWAGQAAAGIQKILASTPKESE